MPRCTIFLIVLALTALLPHDLSAQEVSQGKPFECGAEPVGLTPEALIAKVEEQYKRFSGLSAEFHQRSYFLGLGKEVQSSGKVAFKKPGKMDWNYELPDEQRFVTDGTTLWYYEPKVNQVTLAEFQNSFNSELPVSFLLGVGTLSENFRLEKACRSDAGIVMHLAPKKPDPNLSEFLLLVDAKSFVPAGARTVDAGGNETSITFEKINLDVTLPDERFGFEIPRGVDILDHRGRKAPVQEMNL